MRLLWNHNLTGRPGITDLTVRTWFPATDTAARDRRGRLPGHFDAVEPRQTRWVLLAAGAIGAVTIVVVLLFLLRKQNDETATVTPPDTTPSNTTVAFATSVLETPCPSSRRLIWYTC